jgi:hypothetical protein
VVDETDIGLLESPIGIACLSLSLLLKFRKQKEIAAKSMMLACDEPEKSTSAARRVQRSVSY